VRSLKISFVAGLILVISISCNERGGKYIDQGEIHYNIDYIASGGTMSNEFKPKTLVVSFKKEKILFEILSPIGNQGIINIVNPEKNIYDTYLNMFAARYYYSANQGEMHPGFSSMDGMELKKTNRTTTICGYSCKNAEVTFPSDRKKVYDIWYTNEIKVKNTNASTPYHDIDGVLLSFYFFLGSSQMKFDAETVYDKEIPDKSFERRLKFRLISKPDMDKIITKMVNL
jgi:hypothetical protein